MIPSLPRFLVLCGLAVLAPGGVAARAAERTNVIVILMDDLGGRDLGCYGSTYHRTPHLDRLAAAGMKFTDAYAACPVCSPTRAALLTGRYPARFNLTDFLPGRPDRPDQKLLRPVINQHLPLEEVTLAKVLQAAGYATGHVGKWHFGGKGFEPQKRGFDVSVAGDESGSPRSYFAPFKSKDGRFMPGLEQAPEGEYLTDRLTAEAERFIEQNRDRPFFLYLAHYAVHIPLRARPEIIARYKAGGPAGTQNNPTYAAMIESMDESVGRIVAKLDGLKLSDRTAVLFTSDNGGLSVLEGPNTPSTVNSPFREGKGYLYEGGTRVPLLVKWPGVTKAGTVSGTPACSIDFFPTILDLCGVKDDTKVDGVSLRPVLRGEGDLAPRALYWHYPHYCNQGARPGGSVREGDYKLIEFFEDGRRELYNVKKDVGETHNLIEEKPEKAKELADKLAGWRKEVGARMMRPNPDYVAHPQEASGIIPLPARTADIHGVQVRYEALPHKNTLGFWTRVEDWVSWDFTVSKPGTFDVVIGQGCGEGQGGSEVEFSVGAQKIRATVEDTGGFQNFKTRLIGTVTLEKPGRYRLEVRPKSKPGVAVMDLRSVGLRLKRAEK
jgi:arylsulfatase A-like enzyme